MTVVEISIQRCKFECVPDLLTLMLAYGALAAVALSTIVHMRTHFKLCLRLIPNKLDADVSDAATWIAGD